MRSVPSDNGLSSFSAPYPFEKTRRRRFCAFMMCSCLRGASMVRADASKRSSVFKIEYVVCGFGKQEAGNGVSSVYFRQHFR